MAVLISVLTGNQNGPDSSYSYPVPHIKSIVFMGSPVVVFLVYFLVEDGISGPYSGQ